MKHLLMITAIFFLICTKPALAIPINASTGVNLSNSLLIAGGGPLPLGLEVRTLDPLALELSQDSFLNSPDAVPFEDSLTVIAGLAPEVPSRFFRLDSSTRNGGTEGAVASNNHRLYQIREVDEDNTSDVSERGVWGESLSQASLTTDFHEASANAKVFNERRFSISNQNATALTFGAHSSRMGRNPAPTVRNRLLTTDCTSADYKHATIIVLVDFIKNFTKPSFFSFVQCLFLVFIKKFVYTIRGMLH